MRERVLDVMSTSKGIITSAELRRIGVGPAALRTMLRQGEIVRLFRGAYARADLAEPDPEEIRRIGRAKVQEQRHLLMLDAVLRSYGSKVGASHQSAVLAWGLPVLLPDLDRVHVSHTRAGATGRRHDAFTVHRCELPQAFVRHDGRRVVVPPLAVLGAAALCGLRAGVVAMDSAIRKGRTDRKELAAWLDLMRHHPGLSTARAAYELADGRAESAGETLLRLILVRLGLRFEAQHWIRTADGRHHRVDFYLPELGVVLEFDGLMKYQAGRSLPEHGGRSGQVALADEKLREDSLRLDGYGVGRVIWSQLDVSSVAAVIRKAAGQARPHARHRPAVPPSWAAAGPRTATPARADGAGDTRAGATRAPGTSGTRADTTGVHGASATSAGATTTP